MKTKIKDLIKAHFKKQIEIYDEKIRKKQTYDGFDLVDSCIDLVEEVEKVELWSVINPDDESTFPDDDRFVLVSFENFSVPQICRYHRDEDGGAFYLGDDYLEENGKSLSQCGVVVNAWMEIPKCYKEIE